MRILLAGGGSGGHVTPLRAISTSLQAQLKSDLELTIISDRKFFSQTEFLFKDVKNVSLKKISSGKFRRYNSKSLLWHLTHLPTLLANLRDIFLIGLGVIQAVNYFLWHRPAVVFCKGGYVCVPIGVAARLFRVPLVIHDSDAHPGLTNRFLSRWAITIGTGMPTKYYQYPPDKMVYSGIPVEEGFRPFNKKEQEAAKKALGLSVSKPLVLVTGGGTGAKELNNIVARIAEKLLKDNWQIIQLTGTGKSSKVLKIKETLPSAIRESWQILEFAEILPLATAADVIVSRAGATAMQEFANAGKPVILVPNPYLTGGHQLKNAAMFKENGAAIVLQEADLKENPNLLAEMLEQLLNDPEKLQKLAGTLFKKFAKPKASEEIAAAIVAAFRAE